MRGATRRKGGSWRLIIAKHEEDLQSTPTATSSTSPSEAVTMPSSTTLSDTPVPPSMSPIEALLQKCPSIKPLRPAPPSRELVSLPNHLIFHPSCSHQIVEGGHSWEPGLALNLASMHGLSAEEALHLSTRWDGQDLEMLYCLHPTDMETLRRV